MTWQFHFQEFILWIFLHMYENVCMSHYSAVGNSNKLETTQLSISRGLIKEIMMNPQIYT